MANTVKVYADSIDEAVKSYQRSNKRHTKRAENRVWQELAREFKGVK